MNGLEFEVPESEDDSRELWRQVALQAEFLNGNWTIKMPPKATIAPEIQVSEDTLAIDFSRMGYYVTGCQNGSPFFGVALFAAPPKQLPAS